MLMIIESMGINLISIVTVKGEGKDWQSTTRKDNFMRESWITSSTIQASIVFSYELEIICIYRSNSCEVNVDAIFNYCNHHKTTMICGDMNFCFYFYFCAFITFIL